MTRASNAPVTAAQYLDSEFVAAALGDSLRERGGPPRRFTRAVIDSRLVRPGDLFVALPGEHHDGHDFAAAAIAAGAAGLLLARPAPDVRGAEDDGDGAAGGVATFLVDDALAALQRTAAAWRRALPSTQVVGVTGNVGKTTTKLMVASVLGTRYRVEATSKNYNNEIGVPLCLLELTPEVERAVIEMGMYTTGEISLLCEWALPRVGVVLNVGPVHLERAGSMQAIVRAKRELIEALPSTGHALLNADDSDVRAMASHTRARVTLFGTAADADVRGSQAESRGAEGFDFTLHAAGRTRRLRVPLPGAHLLSNVLATAAVGLAEGLSFDEVADAIERLDVPLRLTVRRLPDGVTLLDDTYNANPASTLGALDLLAEMPGRRVALLGDMRELGPLSDEWHVRVGRHAAQVVDALYTVGDLGRLISESARDAGLAVARHIEEQGEAAAVLRDALRPGDVVLVKGSRALALETVVGDLAPDDAPDGNEEKGED